MDELFNNAPCGFLAFADDGTIRVVNATLVELLGYDAAATLQGRHVESILSAGGRLFYQTHLFPLMKMHGRAEEIYISLRTCDGGEIPVLLNAVRREREGAYWNECVFVVMRQRSRYEDEILLAKRTAEEAIRNKQAAYAELAEAHSQLEALNMELEAQQEELLSVNSQLHARVEREALLNRIGQALRGSTDLETIQHSAVTALGEALGTDRCFYARYDILRNRAWVSKDWHRGDLSPMHGERDISDLKSDLRDLYRPDESLVVTDALGMGEIPSAAAKMLSRSGLRSLVGVGLFRGEQLVASLNTGMAERARDWTNDEIALVEAVATQIRSASEMAHAQQREHRIATELQDALQPAVPEHVPNLAVAAFTRPALDEAEVGGDFYDVFALDDQRYAIVIGDVSGKGLAAAAQLATVRNALRTALYLYESPAEAATRVNSILATHGLLIGFVTAYVGLYDTSSGNLTYVSCGHEPALVRRASSGAVDVLKISDLPLGVSPIEIYQTREVDLEVGDSMMLYTDGLSEAGPSRRELLGTEGLANFLAALPKHLSLDESATRIVLEAQAYAKGEFRDDVCVLMIRRK